MSTRTVTLAVPDPLYRHLVFLAGQQQHSVEAESVALLAATLPENSALPNGHAEALEELALLDDSSLAQAAALQLPADVAAELEQLHLQRQREGIDEASSARLATLLRQYERTMLVRAKAAALLKQRSCAPDPSTPL